MFLYNSYRSEKEVYIIQVGAYDTKHLRVRVNHNFPELYYFSNDKIIVNRDKWENNLF